MHECDIYVNGIYRMSYPRGNAMKSDYRVVKISGRKVTVQIREAAGDPQDTYEMGLGRFAAMADNFAPDSPKPQRTK